MINRRTFLKWSGAAGISFPVASRFPRFPINSSRNVVSTDTETAAAIHILNRLTWGTRPQDVEKIRTMGTAAWLAWQLQPDTIPDTALDKQIASTEPALFMTPTQLANSVTKDGDNYYEIELALIRGRIRRAIYSERQLYERVVEFWSDHFNIPVADFSTGKLIDDRDVIRRHALGKFRDLLLASAQSAAMLRYLNNDSNSKEDPNENYAREVMELHTLGVAGGYTERDVKEAARALTGWTITGNEVPQFRFNADDHDTDAKTILGVTFPAGRGIEDGLQLLDMLAAHPATAQFICTKLAKRFVSETPPEALIASTARVFTSTGGDIRQVLTHLLTSEEFMQARGKKFRRPLEFIVAALRVTGAQVDDFESILGTLGEMGHYPFYWSAPNGYPDTAARWLNSNGMLARWKIAQAICSPDAADEIGVTTALDQLIPTTESAEALVNAASRLTHPAGLPNVDLAPILALARGDSPLDASNIAERRGAIMAALLASPGFQWQ